MSSSNKKRLILNTVSVNLGCNSCKKPNISNIFNPKPKHKATYHNHHLYYSSYSTSSKTTTTPTTTTSLSPATDTPPQHYWDKNNNKNKKKGKCSRTTTVRGLGRVGGESEAVEKDSDDPYLDFRHSMLQMILEKEIYSKDDLKELLNCFLQLNSPYHHGIIVRAFTEIWNGVYSVKPSPFDGSSSYTQSQQHQKLHYYYGG